MAIPAGFEPAAYCLEGSRSAIRGAGGDQSFTSRRWEVAESLKTRNAFPIPFGIALWEYYVRAAFSAGPPDVIVSYEQLVGDSAGTTRRLLENLSELGIAGLRVPEPAQLA